MPGIKAGLMVSNQQFEGVDMVSALEDQYVMVRLARDRGWDSYFTGQHYLNEGGNQGLQMVPYLARLAAEAGDMTMGVGLLLAPLHNPPALAALRACADALGPGVPQVAVLTLAQRAAMSTACCRAACVHNTCPACMMPTVIMTKSGRSTAYSISVPPRISVQRRRYTALAGPRHRGGGGTAAADRRGHAGHPRRGGRPTDLRP